MTKIIKTLKSSRVFATVCAFLASAIWGSSFVTQKIAGQYMGAFTYNGIRFALGTLALLPAIMFWDKKIKNNPAGNSSENSQKHSVQNVNAPPVNTVFVNLFIGRTRLMGLAGGAVLFLASNLQQFGIVLSNSPSSASEAGFITGMYTVFVPILGLAVGRKTRLPVWVGAVLAFGGLALISIDLNEAIPIQASDTLLLLCAALWAVHILLIDKFINNIDPLRFAAEQFAVCSILCIISALIFESVDIQAIRAALPILLFGGIVVSGLAYTLQIISQRKVAPSKAAIIFSLEALFAALAETLFLGETMTTQKYFGGAIIFAGVILSQRKRD
ncbi:MAG: DMT family transporter [Oscillospiraceae bacterium]|nr:DMT family transporter [Oscillospiraceae bacterium]